MAHPVGRLSEFIGGIFCGRLNQSMGTSTAAHKQEVTDQLEIVAPRNLLSTLPRAGKTEIRRGSEVLATIETPSLFSSERPCLRISHRQLRFDRPDDAGITEGLGNFLRSFSGMPQRRAIWRAGAGIATEIRETSPAHDQLSGRFSLDGQPWQVRCTIHSGLTGSSFEARISGPGGVEATVEPSAADAKRGFLTPQHPMRLDALVIGTHMISWLMESAHPGKGGDAGGGG